jgi:class 3 adenylate cyclase
VVAAERERAYSPTLTFLFTDIEGHFELWDTLPDAASEALRGEHAIMASLLTLRH